MRLETIDPTLDKKLWIKLPVVETKVYSSNKLEYFPIQMKLEELKKIKAKLLRADIITRKTEQLGADIEVKKKSILLTGLFVLLSLKYPKLTQHIKLFYRKLSNIIWIKLRLIRKYY